MTDRNTISQVIESLFEDWIDKNVNVHPLAVENMRILEADALAMLKEQDAIEPSFNERMKYFVCRNCSLVLNEGRDNYCPSCGKRIAWDEYYIHEDETEGR